MCPFVPQIFLKGSFEEENLKKEMTQKIKTYTYVATYHLLTFSRPKCDLQFAPKSIALRQSSLGVMTF